MILDGYNVLLLPDNRLPWAEIALLTDWQIENYMLAATERKELLDALRNDEPPPPTRRERELAEPEGPQAPSRRYMVSLLMECGLTNEQANLEYDRQAAVEQARLKE